MGNNVLSEKHRSCEAENEAFRSLLDETSAMITVIDAETFEILYANRNALEATKNIPGSYIGATCYNHISGRSMPCPDCVLMNKDFSSPVEKDIPYGNKTYRMMYKLISWNGRRALMERSEDITQLKQNELYARERSNMMMSILNHVPAGIMTYRFDGKHYSVIDANKALCDMLEVDADKTVGTTDRDILKLTHPDDVGILLDVAKKLSVPGSSVSYEFRSYLRKSKRYAWMSSEGRSVLQPDGSIYWFLSYVDVTSKKRYQQESKALSDQIKDIFDHIHGGVCMYSYRDGKLRRVVKNEGFRKLFGFSEGLEDENIAFTMVHPDDVESLKASLEKSLSQHTLLRHTYRVFAKEKAQYIWVRLEATVIPQEDEIFLYANYIDVTEQMRNEQNLNNIVSSITGGFAVYDVSDGVKTLLVTDGIPKMQGYTRKEYLDIVKNNALEIVYRDDRALLAEKLKEAIANRASFHISYRVYCKNNSLIWVNLSAFPANTSSDDRVVYNAVFTSVSEQFDLYQRIVDNSESGAVISDKDSGEIYYINSRAYSLLGVECNSGVSDEPKISAMEILKNAQQNYDGTYFNSIIKGKMLRIKLHDVEWLGRKAILCYISDVTKDEEYRKLIENEKERYRIVVDRLGIALADYDMTTGKFFTNKVYSQYAVSQSCFENVDAFRSGIGFVHPDDIETYRNFGTKMRKITDYAKEKLRMKMTDGSYRWTNVSCLFFKDENGKRVREIITLQDTDDATTQYVELKKRYDYEVAQYGYNDDIIESMAVNVTNDTLSDYNSRIFDRQKLVNGNRIDFKLLCQDVEMQEKLAEFRSQQYLSDAYHKGITPTIEYRRIMPDGTNAWVCAQARLTRNPQTGELIAFICSKNIDRQKTMEQIAKRLVDAGRECALLVTKTGTVKYFTGTTELFDTVKENGSFGEILMQTLKTHVAEKEREKLYESFAGEKIRANLMSGKHYGGSFSAVVKGRFERIRWSAYYFDNSHQHVMFTFSNITDIYLAEQQKSRELSEALKRAEVAAKAKTDFLARMSHDMRTPMNGILGLTSLLRDRTDPKDISEDVKQIEMSGRYLLNLINDTLDMSKIESGKLELHLKPVNSEDMFGNVLANARLMAEEKGVDLILELPPIAHGKWVPVVADCARVEQVFMNIISNAVKYTPVGGSVKLCMETVAVTDTLVKDKYIISDTGIGMSEEFVRHIYEPFSQEGRANTERQNGTGLGMAIVHQLVSLMGGKIDIKSELGAGTCVTIELSYQRYHGVVSSEKTQNTDFSSLSGKRIMLCEDHPVNAQIVVRLLAKKNAVVDTCENGKIGVETFEKSDVGYYDAILMDIRMPVMDGLSAAKAIRGLDRSDAKSIPIIAMTANAFDDDRAASKNAGMNAHLSKPAEPEKLFDILAQLIKK